jgi:hypothetical protein
VQVWLIECVADRCIGLSLWRSYCPLKNKKTASPCNIGAWRHVRTRFA